MKRDLKSFVATPASIKSSGDINNSKDDMNAVNTDPVGVPAEEDEEAVELPFEFTQAYMKAIIKEILNQINAFYEKENKPLDIKLRKLDLKETDKNYRVSMKFNKSYDEESGGILVEAISDTTQKDIKEVKVITDSKMVLYLIK